MRSLWTPLYKTLVVEYYRLNTGFLFLIVMFGFGILRPEHHIALASYIITSPHLIAVTWLLWGIYLWKTIVFVRQRLLWSSHSFLYHLRLVNPYQRWLLWWSVQFLLWLPVLLYICFVSYYGWQYGYHKTVIVNGLVIFLMPTVAVWAYEYRLKRPSPSVQVNVLSSWFNQRFVKPYWSYFIFYLFSQSPILLFLTKSWTCFVVLAVCKIYPTDTYDERLLWLGALTTAMGHTPILLQLYEFEHLSLAFVRNLPFKISQRFAHYFVFFIVLLLPEVVFLIRYFPAEVSWLNGVAFWLFAVAMLWLIFGRFLQKQYLMDTMMKHGFYTFIALFFLIMFKTPIYVLTITAMVAGLWLFQKHYYQSELLWEKEDSLLRPED